jgi:hypothetical protein
MGQLLESAPAASSTSNTKGVAVEIRVHTQLPSTRCYQGVHAGQRKCHFSTGAAVLLYLVKFHSVLIGPPNAAVSIGSSLVPYYETSE